MYAKLFISSYTNILHKYRYTNIFLQIYSGVRNVLCTADRLNKEFINFSINSLVYRSAMHKNILIIDLFFKNLQKYRADCRLDLLVHWFTVLMVRKLPVM